MKAIKSRRIVRLALYDELQQEENIMKVDINTKFITLIGTPLGQSFAARMQNSGYEAAGFNMLYFYSEADNAGLPHVIDGVRHMPFAGCAVTKPNKVEVMKYVDDYDPLCKKMGSSNTVVKTADGKLVAYNTDGYGALRCLKEQVGELKGKVMFSFGAGGTGRSVCFELANAGAKRIYICSRSATCEELCAQLNEFYPGVCVPIRAAEEDKIKAALAETDIVLNLSGAGMCGKEEDARGQEVSASPARLLRRDLQSSRDPLPEGSQGSRLREGHQRSGYVALSGCAPNRAVDRQGCSRRRHASDAA